MKARKKFRQPPNYYDQDCRDFEVVVTPEGGSHLVRSQSAQKLYHEFTRVGFQVFDIIAC